MKDINKEAFSEFESGWQRAFEDAEISPSNDIWNNIDARLANKESNKYKKRVAYYKWVAAASVLFAIGLSYFSLNNVNRAQYMATENTGQLNTDNTISKKEEDGSTLFKNQEADIKGGLLSQSEETGSSGLVLEKDNNSENNSGQIHGSAIGEVDEALAMQGSKLEVDSGNDKDNSVQERPHLAQMNNASEEASGPVEQLEDSDNLLEQSGNLLAIGDKAEENKKLLGIPSETRDGSLESSYATAAGSLMANSGEAGATLRSIQGFSYHDELHASLMEAPHIYSIPGVAVIRENKSKNKATGLWAGLNLGSSLFDPNFQEGTNFQAQTSPALLYNATNAGARDAAPQEASFKESTDPGISYSLGVNFGLKLTDRFVIQSGLGYAQRRSSTNSITYVQNNKNISKAPAYLGEANSDGEDYPFTNVSQDYQLLNSFEFVSIPLKVGYLIVDRRIGVMVLGGVSADLFLSNTLSETDDKIEEVKVGAGSDSPFRDVNLNGIIGAEFSYEISRNYHLTLEPNYGVALNSFTKSGSNFSSNPRTFGLSAGLKFYLK